MKHIGRNILVCSELIIHFCLVVCGDINSVLAIEVSIGNILMSEEWSKVFK